MSIEKRLQQLGGRLSEDRFLDLQKRSSNWKELSEFLKGVEEEQTVLELLWVEIKTKKRMAIIHRLHSKFNRLRKDREFREIVGMCHE